METGNVKELLEVTEMLSVRIRVWAKHLEHHPDDRCPWSRAGGEAREGEAPPEGRLILGSGHCCHKKDQCVGKRAPGARGPQAVLLNPPQTQSQCFEKVNTSLIWLKVARQTSAVTPVREDPQQLNKEYVYCVSEVKDRRLY